MSEKHIKKSTEEYDETEAATIAVADVIISNDNVYFVDGILATAAIVCSYTNREKQVNIVNFLVLYKHRSAKGHHKYKHMYINTYTIHINIYIYMYLYTYTKLLYISTHVTSYNVLFICL